MARTIEKLTALKIDKELPAGMYGDGGGLYLRVTDDGAKNWVFRFMLNGRARWMGMGPLHTVNLAEARKRAGEHRLRRHDGIDPIEARRADRLKAQLEAAKAITFKECAESYIKAHRAGWKNAKHAAQWEATPRNLCRANHWQAIGTNNRHRLSAQGAGTDMDREARNCGAGARAY